MGDRACCHAGCFHGDPGHRIVNVALPHISGTMSVSNDEATWTLTAYLVANGIVLPISGWLGNTIGRKRYF